jgi:hypothetical protein
MPENLNCGAGEGRRRSAVPIKTEEKVEYPTKNKNTEG